MSAFPPDMLLWPDGSPRVFNSENRIKGEINDVAYVVDLKGDFAVCAYVNRKTGETRKVVQPRFNVIGIVVGCLQMAGTEIPDAVAIGLRPGRHGPEGGARVSAY